MDADGRVWLAAIGAWFVTCGIAGLIQWLRGRGPPDGSDAD